VAGDDPTESGGLFVGRRPGSGVVRFRTAEPGARRRFDGALANVLLALEVLLCLSLLGPQPAAWLWIGSQVQYLTDEVTLGISTIMVGCLASLMGTMALAKRIDHAWKLVRRAAGYNQERGMLELVFAGCVALALVAFGFWFLILEGPAPSFAPTQ
jgi:uncharacterized membrane protein YbhN (UPF0104 family)